MKRTDLVTKSQNADLDVDLAVVDGQIPADLEGVLLRNGPGVLKLGEDAFCLIDGHSLLGETTIGGGKAHLRVRHPKLKENEEERKANRILHRRTFTNKSGFAKNLFQINVGNSGSHDSFRWRGKTLVTEYLGHYALNSETLEDEGIYQWDGAFGPGEKPAPMPREMPDGGVLLYGVRTNPKKGDKLTFIEISAKGEANRRGSIRTRGFVHDHIFSENFHICVENPLKPNLLDLFSGRTALWHALSRGAGPNLLLIPRHGGKKAIRLPMPSPTFEVFHLVNAYEEAGKVLVDMVAADGHVFFDSLMPGGAKGRKAPGGAVRRFTVDPEAGSVEARNLASMMGDAPEVAPAMHGQKHNHAYFVAVPDSRSPDPSVYFFSGKLMHLDLAAGKEDVWDAGDKFQVSAPAFAPKKGAADPEAGYLLSWLINLDTEKTELAIFDAWELAKGPIARLSVGDYLPPVSHARFFA